MDDRTVGVLGGGQLGRMLVEAANNLNISIAVLDKANAPAKQVNGPKTGVNGSFTDPQAIRSLAKKCDVLTVEIEHVDTYVLEDIEKETETEIQPSWRTIRTIQDKYLQKQTLIDGKISVAESIPISSSEEDLSQAAKKLGYPFMLKARTGAYDGRGNFVINSKKNFKAALAALKDRPLYAERWAHFAKELAVMVVKTHEKADTESWKACTLAYPVVETVHQDSICKLTYAPARKVSEEFLHKAQSIARRAIACFEGRGIFGVEMFFLKDGTILVNEIAPRPHNSGHYTIEACQFSQYDSHLRAILDRPIPETAIELGKPAIMLNILGGVDSKSFLRLAEAADRIGANVHLYGKGDATKGRKMGHLTLTASTMEEAERKIQPLIQIADELHDETEPTPSFSETPKSTPSTDTPKQPKPLIGIISGSISDQPILQPCYDLLTTLSIPYERGIKSAHRTPDAMATYAKSAQARGLKIIIAAAGGAAHLPGMVAAFSKSVPVIGLPIKPSIGDGMDSVLSMTNMPKGVPVLTVGVNNAPNAALGAARILAGWDEGVRVRLEGYLEAAGEESLENDRKLREPDEEGKA